MSGDTVASAVKNISAVIDNTGAVNTGYRHDQRCFDAEILTNLAKSVTTICIGIQGGP